MQQSPILWLIAITTLIRLAFAATTGLGVDESYMVAAGRVLSLGYFDHPPISWWLSWGAVHLFGTQAPLAVRFPFILLFALSQWLIARITLSIADQRSAFWAVALFNLSPVFGVTTGTWVLPDGPLDAALLGAALCLLHATSAEARNPWRWWIGAGLCAGLALSSKYSAILTIAGAFGYLLAFRRQWLLRPQPYVAALVAIAVFSPVLLWNATHGWASFAFQGERAAGLRFRPLNLFQTLGGEALFVLPWLWLPMMILLMQGFRRPAHQLLAWLAVVPIAVFALISVWSSQRILFHWAAPGYMMLFPLLGEAVAARLHHRWIRTAIAGSAALTLLAVTIIATQIQFGWLGDTLTQITRKDPTEEGMDWTSVGADLKQRGLLPPGAVVAVLNWRDGGKLGYAVGPDTVVLCLNQDSRQFGFAHPLRDFAGQDAVVLVAGPAGAAAQWFNTTQMLPPTSVRLGERVLQSVTVLRGIGLRVSAP